MVTVMVCVGSACIAQHEGSLCLINVGVFCVIVNGSFVCFVALLLVRSTTFMQIQSLSKQIELLSPLKSLQASVLCVTILV